MPANPAADFLLNGLPFMLWRNPKGGGRAWQRQRVPDALSTQRRMWRSVNQDQIYGGLPDELDHPEIWADWSGGYGHYKRMSMGAQPGNDNHFHMSYNLDTRFPGQMFLAQLPQLVTNGSLNSRVDYFIDVPLPGVSNPAPGAGAVVLAGAGGALTFVPTSAAGFVTDSYDPQVYGGRGAVFGSFVYLPRVGSGTFVQRPFTGAGNAGPLPAVWLAVANGRLWRGYQNIVQSVPQGSDPMGTANWSATVNIGNGFLRSADAQAFEDNIYVGMPDGLYQGNATGTFNNVATDLGAQIGLDSVRDVGVHNGGLVFAEGMHVWWYKPSSGANSTMRQIWPTVDVRPTSSQALVAPRNVGMQGRVTCLHGFGRWLYAGVFNGSQSMVFCGQDASGAGPYVWHPMQLFSETVKVNRIHVDSITATSGGTPIPRRLWVATEASFGSQPGCTAPVYFWPIPQSDETPFGDPTFSANYCDQGYLEQSVTDSETPGVWKAWRKIETWMEGIGPSSASGFAAISAVIDGTVVSTFDSTTYVAKPKDWHYFKNANNDAIGQGLQLQIVLRTAGNDSTPLLRSVVGHNIFRPRIAEQITAKVRIADRIVDRAGGEMRPGATMLDELDTMSRSSNPFPLTDLVGRTYPVIVIPGVDEEESYQDDNSYPEIVATVKMGIVDASWNAAPAAPLHPDGG